MANCNAARAYERLQMGKFWLQTHRPDVWEMIQKEARIKHPTRKKEPYAIPLPKSLKEMK